MCGIAGFIDFNQSSSLSVLEKMTDSLYHRGPDGSGYDFFSNSNTQIGLGHRRFSIIVFWDNRKKPIINKKFNIVFYCVVYN
jgi:asparagine synthase (glutamine-hydrolysing)